MNEWDGTFEMVDPRDIQFDRGKYQRQENWPLISRISAGPSWPAFVVIPCAKRLYANGILYAYDGQQRLLGVLAAAEPPNKVPVVWWPFKTRADEAACFIEVNVNRKSVGPLDKFRAQLGAENPTYLRIQAATEEAGFGIGRAAGDDARTIAGISGLLAIYNAVGEEGLVIGLTAYRLAWPDDNAPTATMLELLADVSADLSANGGLTTDRLAKALSRTTPMRINRKAETLHRDLGGSKRAARRKALQDLAKI